MADSLFDNRYRYDYIYPRGRSGETLRAVDTQGNLQPVVIKRPAPNDAPPIRAGQEVSILNERKALTRLAGHPVLTELLDTGQFSIGGTPHQYIVMERAEGIILEDYVFELSAQGQHIPALEMLVILDHLLDLLQTAHDHDIVYNDVDAKHLFWDPEAYRLKIIDWGNAVFLEGDEITPQGISRQSDIGQVGELIYFILTGGRRLELPRSASDDYQTDFGEDASHIHSRLQGIVTKAVHPNARLRYQNIAEMRKDLSDYRAPIQRERDLILGRVGDRLRHNRSRDELNGLLDLLDQAIAMDPGYPTARELHADILARLQEIEIAADLDAIRIYMENGNMARTVELLGDLRKRAVGPASILVNLLFDMAVILSESRVQQLTAAMRDAIGLIFDAQPEQAARLLLTQDVENEDNRHLQLLLAEVITAHYADVQLLRPNLYRLETALQALAQESVPLTEPLAVLNEINTTLDNISEVASIGQLRDDYRAVVNGISALQTLLDAVNAGRNLPDRKLPLTTLQRALIAAMALADNMHVIGKQGASSPRDAIGALESSRAIDPNNAASWDRVGRRLEALYELLRTCQTYVPAADGSDLNAWFDATRSDLRPFVAYLFDEMLATMSEGLNVAQQNWSLYATATIQGDRESAVSALTQARAAVGTLAPTLAGWLSQLRSVIEKTSYVERHALYGVLGRALADGWEAFDRGRLADAEQLGERAKEIAQDEAQRFAAERLRRLSEITRNWVERNGINTAKGTRTALEIVEKLFTEEELETRENFTKQMPSNETYLKAMNKGLVDLYHQRSSAAVRILFVTYVLTGALDAHDEALDDAEFWHEAALHTLPAAANRQAAARILQEFIERRRHILEGAELLNEVNGSQALPDLADRINDLETNPQARTLAAGVHALRELQAALRDWSDGEFRQAGIKLENAMKAVSEAEQAASITLTTFRAWLMELQAVAAELHTRAVDMQRIIEQKPSQPDHLLQTVHQNQYARTAQVLGPAYAETLKQWHETYEDFLATYTDHSVRRSARLARFNELFRAMFIDRHPAYPLYRHWYDLTEQAPEFPAPPTDEPTPQINEAIPLPESEYAASRYDEEAPVARRPFSIPRVAILGGLGGIVLIVLLVMLANRPDTGAVQLDVTISATPPPGSETAESSSTEATMPAAEGTQQPSNPVGVAQFETPTLIASGTPVTPSPSPVIDTATPSLTPTETATSTPTASFTPSATPTRTATPTVTLPPAGLQGRQDLMTLLGDIPESDYAWPADYFAPGAGGEFWRLGVGATTEGDTMVIGLPPAMLDEFYGNNAASRISRVEATLTLTTFNPPLLLDEDVFFGLLLQDAGNTDHSAGVQVQLVQNGVINLAQRSDGTTRTLSQRTVNAVIVRLRLERDPNTGSITTYFNDEQLGDAMSLASAGAPVIPALFVKDGGVIVSVTDWQISLR